MKFALKFEGKMSVTPRRELNFDKVLRLVVESPQNERPACTREQFYMKMNFSPARKLKLHQIGLSPAREQHFWTPQDLGAIKFASKLEAKMSVSPRQELNFGQV